MQEQREEPEILFNMKQTVVRLVKNLSAPLLVLLPAKLTVKLMIGHLGALVTRLVTEANVAELAQSSLKPVVVILVLLQKTNPVEQHLVQKIVSYLLGLFGVLVPELAMCGQTERVRVIVQNEAYGGKQCDSLVQTTDCNTNKCPPVVLSPTALLSLWR